MKVYPIWPAFPQGDPLRAKLGVLHIEEILSLDHPVFDVAWKLEASPAGRTGTKNVPGSPRRPTKGAEATPNRSATTYCLRMLRTAETSAVPMFNPSVNAVTE
jgi:hypothetical protein